ncbi:MAG: hypothetical protein IJV07_02660 [Alphaproteobacteria bacterium]|nr:hypothetical protein [Alphaproteobacteria bacterium]
MQKIILNPLLAGGLSVIALILFKGAECFFYADDPLLFYEANHGLECITYGLYILAGMTAIGFYRDFIKTDKRSTWIALLFLWLAAFLREMGIQHWLTQHDTTAIKLRFFTNPENPLHEKIIAGALVFLVLGVAGWLLVKYFKRMIRGFFHLSPLYWSIATFGGVGLISQICDRFPSKYFKATGLRLDADTALWLKLFEEGGEACLPIIFALAFVQYHQIKKRSSG